MNKKIIIYILIVLVIALGAFYFLNKPQNNSTQMSPASTPSVLAPYAEPTTVPVASVPSQPSSQPAPAVVPAKTYNVSIINFSFDPGVLNISKGDTVIWTNKDSVPHQIVGAGLGSSVMGNGQSYTSVFNISGTFDYHCAIHPSMKGSIIVQ